MSDSPEQPLSESVVLTSAQVLETLATGVIQEDHGLLSWGSNYAYLAPVTDEQRSLLAVYKPQRGERPLWDFPEGTLCYREVAAYMISEALGWQIVPPTVLRSGPYGLGSVQFFIEHDPEITYFSPFPAECAEQLRRIVIFDYVINNADRKAGHCLLDPYGQLWGIDHGISFHYAYKLRTVIWEFAGQALPESVVEALSGLYQALGQADAPWVAALSQLLSDREIAALRWRIEKMLQTGVFPSPGTGQNYPWPPV